MDTQILIETKNNQMLVSKAGTKGLSKMELKLVSQALCNYFGKETKLEEVIKKINQWKEIK